MQKRTDWFDVVEILSGMILSGIVLVSVVLFSAGIYNRIQYHYFKDTWPTIMELLNNIENLSNQ